MMEREKGVLSTPCPNCGSDRAGTEQADGSVAFSCTTCTTTTEKADATPPAPVTPPPPPSGNQRAGRVVGTDVSEAS